MPYAAPHVCAHPLCRNAATQGRWCAAHYTPPPPRAPDKRTGPNPYDSRWQRFRRWFLAKHPVCSDPICGRPATDVDHIVPHAGPSDPLFWDQSNMQALCHSCHSRKTASDVRSGAAGYGRGKAGQRFAARSQSAAKQGQDSQTQPEARKSNAIGPRGGGEIYP